MGKTVVAQGPVDVLVRPSGWLHKDGSFESYWNDSMDSDWVPLYAIPEGWALVPVEATDEQWDAGIDYNPDDPSWDSYIKGLYRAMVEAGPNAKG